MKKVIIILLAFILMAGLAACNGKDEPESGKPRDGKATEKPTPTGETTPEPTEVPTGTPTEAPTEAPTPVPTLPVSDVYEGTKYVIAVGDGCDRYSDYYKGEGEAFESVLEYLYITEAGYDNLAAAIRGQNYETYRQNDQTRKSAAELLDQVTADFSTQWYETSRIKVWRDDSAVFSYDRTNDTYLGGAQNYAYRSGYSYRTETGEKLSLNQMVKNTEVFANDIVVLLSKISDKKAFFDGWEDKAREAVTEGTVGWVAVDDGLQIWFNTGYLAPYATGEVCIDYPVTQYPDRFVPELVGPYGSNKPKSKKTDDLIYGDSWRFYRSERYKYILWEFIKGIGKMSWDEAAAFLKEYHVDFEGYGDKEAAMMESNAYVRFADPDSGDKLYVQFWQEDEKNLNSTQRVKTIWLNFPGYEFFLLIEADETGRIAYQIIDCSFGESRDSAVVYDFDEAMDVMIMTMDCYYSDVKSAY